MLTNSGPTPGATPPNGLNPPLLFERGPLDKESSTLVVLDPLAPSKPESQSSAKRLEPPPFLAGAFITDATFSASPLAGEGHDAVVNIDGPPRVDRSGLSGIFTSYCLSSSSVSPHVSKGASLVSAPTPTPPQATPTTVSRTVMAITSTPLNLSLDEASGIRIGSPLETDLILLTQLLYECDRLVLLTSEKLVTFVSRVLRRNQHTLLSSNFRQKAFHFRSPPERDPEENHSEFRVECKALLHALAHLQRCSFKRFDAVWTTFTAFNTSHRFYAIINADLVAVLQRIPVLLQGLEAYPDYSVFLTEMLVSAYSYSTQILRFYEVVDAHLESFASKDYTEYLKFDVSIKNVKQALDQLQGGLEVVERQFDSFVPQAFDLAHFVEFLRGTNELSALRGHDTVILISSKLRGCLLVLVKLVQQLEFMAFNVAKGCYDDVGRMVMGERYNKVTDTKKVFKIVERKEEHRDLRSAVLAITKLSLQVKPRIEYLGGVLKVLDTLETADTPCFDIHRILYFVLPLTMDDFALARTTMGDLQKNRVPLVSNTFSDPNMLSFISLFEIAVTRLKQVHTIFAHKSLNTIEASMVGEMLPLQQKVEEAVRECKLVYYMYKSSVSAAVNV